MQARSLQPQSDALPKNVFASRVRLSGGGALSGWRGPADGTFAARPPPREFRPSGWNLSPNHRDPRLSQVDEPLMRANLASDFRRLLAARGADAETKHPPSRIGNSEGGFRPRAANRGISPDPQSAGRGARLV